MRVLLLGECSKSFMDVSCRENAAEAEVGWAGGISVKGQRSKHQTGPSGCSVDTVTVVRAATSNCRADSLLQASWCCIADVACFARCYMNQLLYTYYIAF